MFRAEDCHNTNFAHACFKQHLSVVLEHQHGPSCMTMQIRYQLQTSAAAQGWGEERRGMRGAVIGLEIGKRISISSHSTSNKGMEWQQVEGKRGGF